jgi:NMD protein affecting ribosome stability and mRNA decay
MKSGFFVPKEIVMTFQVPVPGFQPIRRDQLREEREHDSYKRRQKPPEPSVCPDCGAVFHAGRWQWGERQPAATELLCPACHRTRDHFPAGFLHVSGLFFATHRHEMLSLIEHHAEREKAEHPLARIIAIKDEEGGADGMLVTTTDIHLARDLGEALHRAYQGDLEFHYNEAEKLLRVYWRR